MKTYIGLLLILTLMASGHSSLLLAQDKPVDESIKKNAFNTELSPDLRENYISSTKWQKSQERHSESDLTDENILKLAINTYWDKKVLASQSCAALKDTNHRMAKFPYKVPLIASIILASGYGVEKLSTRLLESRLMAAKESIVGKIVNSPDGKILGEELGERMTKFWKANLAKAKLDYDYYPRSEFSSEVASYLKGEKVGWDSFVQEIANNAYKRGVYSPTQYFRYSNLGFETEQTLKKTAQSLPHSELQQMVEKTMEEFTMARVDQLSSPGLAKALDTTLLQSRIEENWVRLVMDKTIAASPEFADKLTSEALASLQAASVSAAGRILKGKGLYKLSSQIEDLADSVNPIIQKGLKLGVNNGMKAGAVADLVFLVLTSPTDASAESSRTYTYQKNPSQLFNGSAESKRLACTPGVLPEQVQRGILAVHDLVVRGDENDMAAMERNFAEASYFASGAYLTPYIHPSNKEFSARTSGCASAK